MNSLSGQTLVLAYCPPQGNVQFVRTDVSTGLMSLCPDKLYIPVSGLQTSSKVYPDKLYILLRGRLQY
jgi:hypothetical protein